MPSKAFTPKQRFAKIDKNWLEGFIEGLFYELEFTLGPLQSDLHDFEVKVHLQTHFVARVQIYFSIISDSQNLKTYFDTSEEDTIEFLRNKVETSFEEIVAHVKTFKREH